MSKPRKEMLRYVVKCGPACTLVLLAAGHWHYADVTWCLISIILVLSSDGQAAVALALARIKGNLVGAASSVVPAAERPTRPLAWPWCLLWCSVMRVS